MHYLRAEPVAIQFLQFGLEVRMSLMCRSLTRVLQGLRVKLPRQLGGYFHNDADHRDFVAIGTAAGEALDPLTPWSRLHVAVVYTCACLS